MHVRLIVVPYDSGMRGARMGAGPERLAPLVVESLNAAGHTTSTQEIELPEAAFPAEVQAAFEIDRRVAVAVRNAVDSSEFPLVLSGNCNTALGTIAGVREPRLGIMWFDAHGDFNTPETTTSGFFDGMALATAAGRCWKQAVQSIPGFRTIPENRIVHFGARDFDPAEESLLAGSAVEVLTASSVKHGVADQLETKRTDIDGVYLHIDLDVLDAREGKANSYAVGGGLSAADLEKAVKEIAGVLRVHAGALTSYDPAFDVDGRVADIAAKLAALMVPGH